MKNEVIKISKSEISLVEESILNPRQMSKLIQKTPKKYVSTRPAKGGGTWNYVPVGYFKKVLNLCFGWNWDFQIIRVWSEEGEAMCHGRLTVHVGDRVIVKDAIGKKEIMFKKGTKTPLSIGNDYKSAESDALKRAANKLGVAADVYNPNEFASVDIEVVDDAPSGVGAMMEDQKEGGQGE